MSRIRSVHPRLFTDESFASASPLARLLLIGVWTEAWDDGVFEFKPLTLKMRIFPADNIDVEPLLDELARLNIITKFENCGRKFGAVRNFCKFQRPKKPNRSGVLPESLIEYVACSDQVSEPVRNQYVTSSGIDHHLDETSSELDTPKDGTLPYPIPIKSEIEKQKEGRKEGRKVGKEDTPLTPNIDTFINNCPNLNNLDGKNFLNSRRRRVSNDLEFERFWQAYGLKIKRPSALKAFEKARTKTSLETILAGVRDYLDALPAWQAKQHPSSWLNAERWTDDYSSAHEPLKDLRSEAEKRANWAKILETGDG